jgi:hypothetical protein
MINNQFHAPPHAPVPGDVVPSSGPEREAILTQPHGQGPARLRIPGGPDHCEAAE